jgi:hypothetical protein
LRKNQKVAVIIERLKEEQEDESGEGVDSDALLAGLLDTDTDTDADTDD